jgi:hypothetical protein
LAGGLAAGFVAGTFAGSGGAAGPVGSVAGGLPGFGGSPGCPRASAETANIAQKTVSVRFIANTPACGVQQRIVVKSPPRGGRPEEE